MVTTRRFADFQREITSPRMSELPEGGVCLSAFLVISKKGSPNHVLMGRLNKSAPWDHIGALDPERAERHSKGWMLPSSHLIIGEGPMDAAKRVLKEQLGVADQALSGPLTFSEVFGSKNHWAIEFVFTGEKDQAPSHDAWKELSFLDMSRTRREEIMRSHEDILAHVHKWNPS